MESDGNMTTDENLVSDRLRSAWCQVEAHPELPRGCCDQTAVIVPLVCCMRQRHVSGCTVRGCGFSLTFWKQEMAIKQMTRLVLSTAHEQCGRAAVHLSRTILLSPLLV